MTIQEIDRIPPKILREEIQNFWANFRHTKRFLTLGCFLERIKRDNLWKVWGHHSLFRYVIDELRFPTGQHEPYIVAYKRLKHMGFSAKEMETIESQHSLYRVLKVSKLTDQSRTFFDLLAKQGEDFRQIIRQRERLQIHFSFNKREVELLEITTRALALTRDQLRKAAIASILLTGSMTLVSDRKKQKKWLTKKCIDFKLPEDTKQKLLDFLS